MTADVVVAKGKGEAARTRGQELWSAYRERLQRSWFRWVTGAFAALMVILVVAIGLELVLDSRLTWREWGISFLWGKNWNPVTGDFGALPFIVGTLLTSATALAIAFPVAIGIAILLSEYMPKQLRNPLIFLVELLAAIPSVVYGLWGIFVLAPFLRHTIIPAIAGSPLGVLPIFGEPGPTYNLFTAGVILSVMILPIIASISREVMLAVPRDQKEAALALGMTRWEAVRKVVLPYGMPGIFSAGLLGLGRALGETMAVTMVIGNKLGITANLFEAGYAMPAIIANEFREAATELHISSLVAIGLVLFVLSFILNSIGRMIILRFRHQGAEGL